MADKHDHQAAGMLAATLFLAREIAHREHLRVSGPGSYAKHAGALNPFYEEVGDLADRFVEAYQGCCDCIIDIPLVNAESGRSIYDQLNAQRQWIRKTRYDVIDKDETPIQNLIDEIELLYFHTLYKLKRLA